MSAVFVIALWRGASELLARMRALASTGTLELRVEGRRVARIERALDRAGLSFVGGPAAPIPVPVVAGAIADQSVHVGRVTPADHDDVGLLEAAMRRAVRERMGVDAGGIERRDYDRVDWASLLADDLDGRDHARDDGAIGDGVGPLALAPVLMAATGVALTVVPLVRPLAGAAPWLALAGGALVLAAWLAARRF